MSKNPWERKGALLTHDKHGVGVVEEIDNASLTVIFQDANPSVYTRQSRPWFDTEEALEEGLLSEEQSKLYVRVSRSVIEQAMSDSYSSCWSFLEASGSSERISSNVRTLSRLIIEQIERPVSFSSKKARAVDAVGVNSLMHRLDQDRHKMTNKDFLLVVIQLSDGYSRKLIELSKVSNGNGGYRISENDIVKARDEKREIVREIQNGSAWKTLIFPSFPIGMSNKINMSMSNLCRNLSMGSARKITTTTKSLLSAFEERTKRVFLSVAEQAEAEANAAIVKKSKKPSNVSLTSVKDPYT